MRKRTVAALAGATVVVGVLVVATTSSGGGHPAARTAVTTTAPVQAAPSTQAATTAPPETTPAAPPATTAPALSEGQQQAVTSAQGYLSDGQGFSEAGLLKQLTSKYGEGFSQADAKFAIEYLSPVDWNAQAVESAKGYLASGQGFSRASLLQQLTSSYGEGFTQAQAEYAVNKVGL